MSLLQHYYTSCLKGTAGYAGFQIKAMSPGISPDDLKTINGMIGYQIPPSLDVSNIASHPIALRYNYLGRNNKCILVCSQSNGPDENGRPGNFFAHTVIADTKDFEVFPPIMFWRHPFWKTTDPAVRIEIPPEPNFDLNPSLEFDQIWSFLDTGQRRDWFNKLLSAVITYDKIKRPIVILDHADNVALWIACVSFALPNILRPFLSFSTYDHDPYKANYRIIGTRRDSRFNFSADEYISFFILNTETGALSDCESSRAADFICQNMQPDLYEDKLSDFFAMCNDRLRATGAGLGEKLEAAASLYLAIRAKSISVTEPAAQQGVELFVQGLSERKFLELEDLNDLNSTADLLLDAVQSAPDTRVLDEYIRVLRVLARSDPSFPKRAQKDIQLLTSYVLSGYDSLAEQLLRACRDLYAQRLLSSHFSQPGYLAALSATLATASCQINQSIWKLLLPFLQLYPENRTQFDALLGASFAAIDRASPPDPLRPSAEISSLLRTIQTVTQDDPDVLEDAVKKWRTKHASSILNWWYYLTVAKLPLIARIPYRERLEKIEPDILWYEFQRDLLIVGAQGLIPQLETWVKHMDVDPTIQTKLISVGVWNILPGLQLPEQRTLAERILGSDLLSPHTDAALQQVLLASYLAETHLAVLAPHVARIYQMYYSHPGLDSRQRGLIGGSLAMTIGRFPNGSIPAAQNWLSHVDNTTYGIEAERLVKRFFESGISLEGHIEMLQATYVSRHSNTFWEIYWDYFRGLLLNTERVVDLVKLLSFWFDDSLGIFAGLPYLAQTFFLQLPTVVEETREAKETSKDFHKAAPLINTYASTRPWYGLIEPLFMERRRKLFGIG